MIGVGFAFGSDAPAQGTAAQLAAWAAQGAWFISWSAGNDANDGKTADTALKTWTEFARRTKGLVASHAGEVLVTQLDCNPDGSDTPTLAYAALKPGTSVRFKGPRIAAGVAGSFDSVRAENVATRTPRAVTVAAVDFTTHVGVKQRIRDTVTGAVAWIVKAESAHVARVHAPDAQATGYPFTVNTNPTEFVAGHAFVVESVGVVRDLEIWGTNLSTDLIDTQARFIVEDFDFTGGDFSELSVVTNANHLISFVHCGINDLVASQALSPGFFGCRIDNFTPNCNVNLYNSFISTYVSINNGVMIFSNVLSNAQLDIYGIAHIEVDAPLAIFDVAAGYGIKFHTPKSSVFAFDIIYGSGNQYGVGINGGASLIWDTGKTPTIQGTNSDVLVDGVNAAWSDAPYFDGAMGSSFGQASTAIGLVQVAAETSKAVTAADVTLTTKEARSQGITTTGALTGNRNVILPTIAGMAWDVFVNNSGAFSLTFKTAAGTGVAFAQADQGKRARIKCDGTNIVLVSPKT